VSNLVHLVDALHLSEAALCACLMLPACSSEPDGMQLIPAGGFTMGAADDSHDALALELGIPKPFEQDAMPAQRVNLPAFYIDRLEVTNAAYLRFVQSTGAPLLPHWKDGRITPDQADRPVVYVDWLEAAAYCKWTGKRLPTEAEWEKAARNGDGRLYPWGNRYESGRANVGGAFPDVVRVGSLPQGASPYGVMDLIGNVWEWTADWYQPYPGASYESDAFGEQYKVVRGASFGGLGHFEAVDANKAIEAFSRASYRWYFPPNAAVNDLGFRCARNAA
jgi:formylglycine-generating enzyme required for sulfatase activity